MNSTVFQTALILSFAWPAAAVNIAGSGTGLLGSNDATITDAGTSHANAGTAANIRDGNLTTRVDNYQTGQAANVNGYVGISWSAARTDVVKSLTLTMATFPDGGWFGNRESPRSGFPLTAAMLVPPVVQVSTNLTTWTTVPSTSDYLGAFTGHTIAENAAPTSRSFTITLPLGQTGMRGIRIIGPTGGWGDGNGFLGVFELAVEAESPADSDADGMDDAWESANGLSPGVNDALLDADSDGLTNEREFRWNTNPQAADSDGDGLSDGQEDTVHLTFPGTADTDGDGLTDGDEINTHLTSPRLADTDSDGLSDAAEINTHLTLPVDRDSDDDGFSDGAEITLSTNPLNAASRSANIARGGRGIIGRNVSASAANLAVTGTPRANANTNASLTDGEVTTRSDTSGMTGTASHAGVVWDSPWPQPVSRLEITFATFADGGWLGHDSFTPGAGGTLAATQINAAPALQTTTDGIAWTTVTAGNFTTDYVTRLIGHGIGGGANAVATRRAAVFTLNTPVSGLRGIRIAGQHRSYLGISEIAACDSTTATDTDGDGLENAAEAIAGTSPTYSDTDGDAAGDAEEVNVLSTNALLPDTDADLFPDGMEVRLGTNPASAASHPQNLSLTGGGIIGVNDAADGDSGTATANAGVPGYLTDGDSVTRVDSWNNNGAGTHSFIGVLWPVPVKTSVVGVQFAIFNHAGWFGPAGTGPAAGGTLTAAHLTAPVVQVTYDKGTTWITVPATSNYVAKLTGHAIAAADNRATRPPLVTFTLASPATGINGLRLIGPEGGLTQPFVGAYEISVVPSYAPLPASTSMTWVPVGNPGNAPDVSGYGAVGYDYSISAYEVSISQYAAFLNAVASSDPHALYIPQMGTNLQTRGIFRSGSPGTYEYHVIGDGNRPMAWVSWGNAARFVNWLQNGQGSSSTETGTYDLTQPAQITLAQVRSPGAEIALPSIHEWHKAAYYDPAKNGGAGGYWTYATRADLLVNNSVSANYYDGDYATTQIATQTGTSHLQPAGHYSSAVSAYGTFDQTGSVWEWVEAESGVNRIYTGGSWQDNPATSSYLRAGFVNYRTSAEPFDTGGFRVVQCPPAPVLFGTVPSAGKTVALAADSSNGASVIPGPDFPATGAPGFSPASLVQSEIKSFLPGGSSVSFAEINAPVTDGVFAGNAFIWGEASGVMGAVALQAYSTKPRFTLAPGIAHAGWRETFLITAPGLQGQSGWLTFNVSVNGNLTASGVNGASQIRVRPTLDNAVVPDNAPGSSSGSGTFTTSGQQVIWRYRSDVPPPVTINTTLTLSIPFTFGQQFRLGLYALAEASSTSTTNEAVIVTGEANAVVKWTGINSVLNASLLPVTGYSVISKSGVPWSGSLPVQCLLPVKSVSLSPAGNGFNISWQSLPGASYRIETSMDLQSWSPLGASISATGAMTSTLFTPGPQDVRQFFRVCGEL